MTTARHCAFLTMDNTDGWSIDADLAIPPLQAAGWQVAVVPWRKSDTDWSQFEAVYIGTPWDYPEAPQVFLEALARIDAAGAVLANPLSLVRWNIAKTYLQDLHERGAEIVPTLWMESLAEADVDSLHERCGTDRIVVKPVISTNATDTFLLAGEPDRETRATLLDTFATRPCMAQPFVAAIQDEGEYSLFYIGGAFSHAIRKVPKARDFRVQEEHGASIRPHVPDAALRHTADELLALVEPAPLYARADFVRGDHARFWLMELELIEPSLYLRMDDGAPQRFAQAFAEYVNVRKSP